MYRVRIREFFIRRLAYKISECVPCNVPDRGPLDWSVAERFTDTPEHFERFVEQVVRTIDHPIETQEQFDFYYSMNVDAAFFEMSKGRSRWFGDTAYWAYTNAWRIGRYGNAPYTPRSISS